MPAQAYNALDWVGREIVDVLSVLVMPVSCTLLQFCLMAREYSATGKSEWNSKRLNSLIEDLLGSGFVEEVGLGKICRQAHAGGYRLVEAERPRPA